MIKDTSLSTQLTFAILPVVLPINPRNGRIVKETKKVEGNTEDAESMKNKELEREIDPRKKYVLKEKIDVLILHSNIKGTYNSSGYYLFLNLPKERGHTVVMKSDSYLTSRNFIDMEEFDPDRKNIIESEVITDNIERKASADRSIMAYIFEKRLLKNTQKDSPFIKNMIIYPSKKTMLKVIINKVNTDEFSENYFEKPILEATVLLRKKMSEPEDESPDNALIVPSSVSENAFVFSGLDDIPRIGTYDGTYDEADNSFLGRKKFINFANQKDGKFEVLIRPKQPIGNDIVKELMVELKIEKASTTSINVLIIG